MTQAKVRDGYRCRACGAQGVEGAHLRDGHRGMGGNPAGDRTTREKIITLCPTHHEAYDRFWMDIVFANTNLADGPVWFKMGPVYPGAGWEDILRGCRRA